MKFIDKIKIDLQRWIFRRNIKRDAEVMGSVIKKANRISEKTKKRLWVFKIDNCDYRIYTKAEVKGTLRSMHLQTRINMYQTNEYLIHITKKPD